MISQNITALVTSTMMMQMMTSQLRGNFLN